MSMTGDDIPTEITKLVYTSPWVGNPATRAMKLSQNDAAAQLAHYWPAIEAHIREQVATEIETAPGWCGPDNEWMDSRDRDHAARIARRPA
ncbi:hypothetical protein ACIQGZ_17225 [Streptomyces sp. NPDC092296]|uniref:hypothetical protein n=1 Tax=Streptomyces sp. NPDC092296 TaxID=3366012 RepID=UPI0037FE2997